MSVPRSKQGDGTSSPRSGAHAIVVCAPRAQVFAAAIPKDGQLVIGRGDDADIRIIDDSVSRRHARLQDGNPPTIEDLGSRNGTRVRGEKLARGDFAPMPVGCVVEIGDVTLLMQRAGPGTLVHVACGREAAASPHAQMRGARSQMNASPPSSSLPAEPTNVIVEDAAMKRLYELVNVFAPSDLSVLVLGETGTGKEVYAEAIHRRSPRAGAPLLKLNCAALPESILEGELFGYERGAFTGAVAAKPGLFESAHGGTVFLDELGEMPLTTQAKLLRVLETGEVMRLGSVRTKQVEVRFVGATNQDLAERVRKKEFRADLYYRINGVTVTLPPLRERPNDIVALAHLFARKAAEKMKRSAPAVGTATVASPPFSDEALAKLRAYSYPGNIRELRNMVERAVLLSAKDPAIRPEHLDIDTGRDHGGGAETTDLRDAVDQFEKQRIVDALAKCDGNQTRAAALLGIGRRTLVTKLQLYGIARPRKT